MSDRHSDGGAFARRSPGANGPVPDADSGITSTGLESALGSALRVDTFSRPAEEQAIAAFRAARDAGVHAGVRTRRRDDWRPRRTSVRRSVKTTLAVFLASLTLGGAAMAAIGSPGSSGKPHNEGPGHGNPSATVAQAPPATTPSKPGTNLSKSRPSTAKDIEAHCRAYPSVKGRGKALSSSAWQRFLAAAGGADNVAAYCADRLSGTEAGGTGKASGQPNSKAADKKPGHQSRKDAGRQ
ncbi:hypothetical protein ACWGQ5_02460 [Streptomyces sp. NPDC055722]